MSKIITTFSPQGRDEVLMKIEVGVHVYFHSAYEDEVDEKLNSVLHLLKEIQRKEVIMMATLDEALAKVTEQTTVDQSLITLTGQIKTMLDAALAGALSPAQQAKVDAIFSGVQNNMSAVSKAVLDNTPQAPPA